MSEFTNELLLAPPTPLAVEYVATWNGAPLASTRDAHGPRRVRFAIDGRELAIRERSGAGRGVWSAVARSVLQRSAFELVDDGRAVLASATARGWFDPGYDLDVGERAGGLDWLADDQAYAWHRRERLVATIARSSGRARAVVARCGDDVAKPIVLFLALLALARWETLTRSDAVTD